MKKKSNSPNYAAFSFLAFAILLTSFTLVAANTPVVVTYANSQVLGDFVTSEPIPVAGTPGTQLQPLKRLETSTTNPSQPKGMPALPPGQRVTIKSDTNGVIRGELQKEGKTYRFQVIKGRLQIETQNGSGQFTPASSGDETAARDLLMKQEIKVSSAGGQMQLEHNGVRAGTELPISINATESGIRLRTPEGETVLKTPPDVAVESLIKSKLGEPESSGSAVGLTMRDGKPVYRIQGQKQSKLFGVFPITLPTTTYVESNNGQVVAQDQSLLTSILRFFSR